MTSQTKMYVLINTDHYMSPGKIAAQTAHAVTRLLRKMGSTPVPESVIVLRATGTQMNNIHSYLSERHIESQYYIDEGVNEVPPFTVTALAVQPLDDDEKQNIFKDFKLL